MKWIGEDRGFTCCISSELVARVWRPADVGWFGDIRSWFDAESLKEFGPFVTDREAKAAVASWIGKTMAQLSNALAAGEPRIDEE